MQNWPHHSSLWISPLVPNPTKNSVQDKHSLLQMYYTHCFVLPLQLYTPSCTHCSDPDTLSPQIPHTRLPTVDAHAFSMPLYAEWPSPSSPTETLSGLLQIKPQNVSFPKTTDLSFFGSALPSSSASILCCLFTLCANKGCSRHTCVQVPVPVCVCVCACVCMYVLRILSTNKILHFIL